MDFTKISFPGLGIGAIEVPAAAFSIGSFQVSWTLLLIVVGAVLAFFYASARAKKVEPISMPRMLVISLSAFVVGLIFARGAYVISTLGCVKYTAYDVVAFWNGGLSVGAGVIGALLAVLVVSDLMKYRSLRVIDSILPGVLLVQLIASVSTFLCVTETVAIADTSSYYLFNGAIEFAVKEGGLLDMIRMEVTRCGVTVAYHPVFLYALVWNLIAFVVVHLVYSHRRFSGQATLVYLIWTSLGNAALAGLMGAQKGCNAVQCGFAVVFVVALIALIVRYSMCLYQGVFVEGEVIVHRTFTRVMTDEERAAKKAEDIACVSEMLEQKVLDTVDDINSEAEAEVEDEAEDEAEDAE